MIVRQPGEAHYTKEFGNGTVSDRVILPGRDEVQVKVTTFRPKMGFTAQGIRYQCNETCYVVRGALIITTSSGEVIPLSTGCTFHVPAGESYDLEASVDSQLVCIFSAGPDGTLPDDE